MQQGIAIDKKIMRQDIMWKDFFRVLLKTGFWKDFYATGYTFWGIFYARGYKALGYLPHTPVTSLVKYLPGFGSADTVLIDFY